MDLLKVDVERAELEVLMGIDAADWPRIRQIAMEVHDLDNRLSIIQSLLRDTAGFTKIETDQDGTLTGSSLYTIYATRT